MFHPDPLFVLKLAILCILWYISSAGGNLIGKMVLNEFPYPMTMTMVQLSSAALYLGPFLTIMGIPHTGNIDRREYLTMIVPLAFGKFISSVSSHISIWKVSVSYAHTVKATLPLFTVILMRIFFKEKQSWQVYLSLMPIISGVIIATVTEIAFDVVGLCSALFATLGFSLQTIFSKKALKDTGLHSMRLLLMLSRISTLLFLPFWLVVDVTRISRDKDVLERDGKAAAIGLILLDGICNMMQNVFAFSVLAMVNPLSYAVANATKRVVIIGASLMMFRNPVSLMNFVGMMVAILGVFLYNKAKYDQHIAEFREKSLPYVHSESDLTQHDHRTLIHSKSEADIKHNGLLNNHIVLEGMEQMEKVTLIPVSDSHGPYERMPNGDVAHDLHSRSHVYHV